jgi:hypothetical protein
MKNSSGILDDYRKRDVEARLNLFLECPEFRREFIEIEQREADIQKYKAANIRSRVNVGNRSLCSPIQRVHKRALTCCR